MTPEERAHIGREYSESCDALVRARRARDEARLEVEACDSGARYVDLGPRSPGASSFFSGTSPYEIRQLKNLQVAKQNLEVADAAVERAEERHRRAKLALDRLPPKPPRPVTPDEGGLAACVAANVLHHHMMKRRAPTPEPVADDASLDVPFNHGLARESNRRRLAEALALVLKTR